MDSTNLTLIALLFLLLNSETLTTTQVLLLLALLSTTHRSHCSRDSRSNSPTNTIT